MGLVKPKVGAQRTMGHLEIQILHHLSTLCSTLRLNLGQKKPKELKISHVFFALIVDLTLLSVSVETYRME